MDDNDYLAQIHQLESALAEKQIEIEALKKSKVEVTDKFNYLKNLISLFPGNVYWKNTAGNYLGCNQNVAKMVGLSSPKEIHGKTIYDLIDKRFIKNVLKIDGKVISENRGIIAEEKGLNEKGKLSTYLTHKIPLHDKNGNVSGLLGVSFDITTQKNLEKKLKKTRKALEEVNKSRLTFISKMRHFEELITLLPGNVYWKSRDGTYLGCNENMAKILNLKSPREIINKTAYDITEGAHAKLLVEIDEKIMRNDKSVSLEEQGFNLERKEACYITKKTPIHDERDNVIGLLGVSIDITERKKLEESLELAKQKAEEANNLKLGFIKNMEHDIRTPFNGIFGIANHLFTKETDESKKELLGFIVNSAKELLEYCNSILDFSKIEAGNLTIIARKFSIREIIDRVITAENPTIVYKKIKFQLNYDTEIPWVIIGDDYRLYRIVINLLSNAIKFTPDAGTVTIKVTLLKIENRQAIIEFNIEDSGIGISDEQKLLIYEKFSRLHPSNINLYKGLGLGLKIVKRFINELEGEISVASEPGKGAAFSCILPFRLPLIDKLT